MINKITKQLHAYALLIMAVLTAFMGVAGCSDDDSLTSTADYGYVQFKLFKEASYNAEGRATSLDKLSDAHKISVVMQHEGHTITQSLVLNAYDNENAEYGLRSNKLQLLVGDYTIIGYFLYDNLDNEIYAGSATDNKFTVIKDGLVVKDLTANVTPKGKATFRLVKNFVESRATDETYPLDNVLVIDVTVKNVATLEEIEIEKMKVKFEQDFTEDHIKTSYGICDTTVWLKAGTYKISQYVTYSDKNGKTVLEAETPKSDKTFTIADNQLTENVEVPITMTLSDEYIKDYIALKEIWEALDGPNWHYYGEAEIGGTNWNFDKDVDLWGDQPGVQLHANGRIASISLAGMGAKGVVPDAIGQLTELEVLALGTHDEKLGGHLFDGMNASTITEHIANSRYDYEEKFLRRDARESLSDILQEAINKNPDMKPIRYSNRIDKKDVQFGNITNQITGISRAMMRLTNLKMLYIANSPITHENFFVDIKPESPYYAERNTLSWENLETLTDIEIYNCVNLTALPMELLGSLPELQLLNIACNKNISGEQLKSDWEALIDGKSGERLQVLYMGYNNLKEFPSYDYLKRMKQLGMLDATNNQIEVVHPFGKEINLTKLYLDYNKIKEINADEADGYFFGYFDVESFTCTHNELTELPDIFNAKSVNVMGSVDFSYNKMTKVENGENFRGYNTSTLNLSYNKFEEMPKEIMQSGSPISTLNMAGNGMKSIPDSSLIGKYTYGLVTIDLSFNNLKKLPKDFYARNMPYLYGVDVSYNCFDKFPYEPFDGAYISTFGIRHQRDAQGNRTLKEWPTGIYQSPSMQALYMGSNDLRKIEDTISPYIRILEIKDNPNISIDVSDVCAYIQAGLYMLIYDTTQDIRGCDYLGIVN
ncbi:MAG: DUF4458 domain-containing protein [Bacteroidales bacterium]|nr:DUF4458 domain-containing protein [Bacteroidales bacterium]